MASRPPPRGSGTQPRLAPDAPRKPALLTVARIQAMGYAVSDFVDATGEGKRLVDRVDDEDVILDLGSRVIAVARRYLPAEVVEGQWLLFRKQGDVLTAVVDARVTLEGQRKITDLFARLTLSDDE